MDEQIDIKKAEDQLNQFFEDGIIAEIEEKLYNEYVFEYSDELSFTIFDTIFENDEFPYNITIEKVGYDLYVDFDQSFMQKTWYADSTSKWCYEDDKEVVEFSKEEYDLLSELYILVYVEKMQFEKENFGDVIKEALNR